MKSVKEVNKGDYILHRNEPCRVVNKENVTYSTHCHTKLKLEVEGLFTNSKEIVTLLPHQTVEEVEILRKKGQIIAKLADRIQIMDLMSYETLDGHADKELFEQLAEGDEVTFVNFGSEVRVLEKR